MKKVLLLAAFSAALLFNGCSSGPSVAGAPENVKTYLIGEYEDAKVVEKKLKDAGFEILAVTEIGSNNVPNIIVTNAKIRELANRPMRGFLVGAIRVFVNKERNEIKVNNPMYFFKAFLQKEYKPGDEKSTVDALLAAIPTLKDVKMEKSEDGTMVDSNSEHLGYDDISSYHYMVSMPYYHDQNELGRADSVDALVAQLKGKAKKNLIYLAKLADNRYVAGVNIGKRTEKFPKKIGEQNAMLLPWQILIEEIDDDGKKVAVATALDGKYRIALGYPQLSMVGSGSFAGIMSIPGALEDDLKKYFK